MPHHHTHTENFHLVFFALLRLFSTVSLQGQISLAAGVDRRIKKVLQGFYRAQTQTEIEHLDSGLNHQQSLK